MIEENSTDSMSRKRNGAESCKAENEIPISKGESRKILGFFVDNNAGLFSVLGVLFAALGFGVIYYYSFLIGRPHLFLSSMHIGPDIFYLLLFFIFGVLCFFSFISINSFLFAFVIHVLRVRLFLKSYAISVVIYVSFFLLFVCFLLAGFADLDFSEFITALYLITFSIFFFFAIFSVAGNYILNRRYDWLRGIIQRERKGSFVSPKKKRMTYWGKKVNDMYLADIAYLQSSNIVSSAANLIIRSVKGPYNYIRIKGLDFFSIACTASAKIFLVAAFSSMILFFCMYMFVSSWEVFLVARRAEGIRDYQPYSAAIIFLMYGMLPGVIFSRSNYRGFERFKQVIIVSSAAFFVVCIFTYGIFGSLVSYSVMMMGVRDSKPSFYNISEKYYKNEMAFSSWGAIRNGGRYQVSGMVLYRLSSVVYLCPADFYKKNMKYWRENYDRCIVGNGIDVESGVK